MGVCQHDNVNQASVFVFSSQETRREGRQQCVCTKCVVSQLVDGVLVLSEYFPSCGWGVVPSMLFPHHVDGVQYYMCISQLVDGV